MTKKMLLFSRERGNVTAFLDPAMSNANLFKLDGWEGFEGFKAFVTTVGVSKSGNFQFLHTLGGGIYLYVFGGRIGQAVVAGLAFDYPCHNAEEKTGIEHVLEYYEKQNIVARKTPLTITIGHNTAFRAYLTEMNAKSTDPKDGIYEFTMSFVVPPPSKELCRREASEEVRAMAHKEPDADEDYLRTLVDDLTPDLAQLAWTAPTGATQAQMEIATPVEPGLVQMAWVGMPTGAAPGLLEMVHKPAPEKVRPDGGWTSDLIDSLPPVENLQAWNSTALQPES